MRAPKIDRREHLLCTVCRLEQEVVGATCGEVIDVSPARARRRARGNTQKAAFCSVGHVHDGQFLLNGRRLLLLERSIFFLHRRVNPCLV